MRGRKKGEAVGEEGGGGGETREGDTGVLPFSYDCVTELPESLLDPNFYDRRNKGINLIFCSFSSRR